MTRPWKSMPLKWRVTQYAKVALLILAGAALAWFFLGEQITDVVTAVVNSGQPVPATQLIPPCVTEDAPGPCYWDADTMGNGTGDSFTVDAHGRVTYWED